MENFIQLLKKAFYLSLLIISIPFDLISQAYPWPQNITYPFGFKPSAVSQATMTSNAQTDYTNWKNDFVTTTNAGGFRRVRYQQASSWNYTASEGIGYGMILSAYSADKALFDDLYGYYNLKIQGSTGLMAWKTDYNGNCSGGDCDAATDGDEDIAFALLVAHCQWGSAGAINYKQKAINAINALMSKVIDLPSGRVRPGPTFGGAHCVDPSYFLIAYYPLFQAATGDANWNIVRNYCLNYFNTTANSTSGLYRDWSQDDGTPPTLDCNWREQNYAYDASRIPWRLANDYLWNGTTISRDAARKMVTWTRTSSPVSGNTSNFRDCMNWNGSGNCGSNSNNPVVGGMAVGAMALDNTIGANVTWANSLYTENRTRTDDYFYNATLKVLYQFVQSGNFWKPTCDVLPLDLLNFSLVPIQNDVLLKWNTSNEKDILTYKLERSTDGINYTSIVEIPANKNGGSYEFIDTEIEETNQLLYYRLSETNSWGETSIIKTNLIIRNESIESTIELYPNPNNKEELTISFHSVLSLPNTIEISINDMLGNAVANESIEFKSNNLAIKIPIPLQAGMYSVVLKTTTKQYIKKLIVY